MTNRPSWFRDGKVYVSYAETVGINKDGHDLFQIDASTGNRTSAVDDQLQADVEALLKGTETDTSRWVPSEQFSQAVPNYYDDRQTSALDKLLATEQFEGFFPKSLGELIDEGEIHVRHGHGSPSADMRGGNIPYIKVSDIRGGQVNVNPSNMVSEVVAGRFWKSESSGLEPFDLLTPIRSSKNIGEFSFVMPGQERIVLTKEVLVLRSAPAGMTDNFFLMWALALKVVRNQWRSVVFMQTNREDVGSRYREIQIPWVTSAENAHSVSQGFRTYYSEMERLRTNFTEDLSRGQLHHVFLGPTTS